MKKSTLKYYNGGDNYKGTFNINLVERKRWHKKAKESGQVGYLTGYHYDYDGEKSSVVCYFRKKPSFDTIKLRRRNGLLRATWYWL